MTKKQLPFLLALLLSLSAAVSPSEVKCPTPAVHPHRPTNFSAEVISSSEVLLSWEDNEDNDIYTIAYRRKVGDHNPWTYVGLVTSNQTSIVDSNLSPGIYIYFIWVYSGTSWCGFDGAISSVALVNL